jgi:antitoxin HicB
MEKTVDYYMNLPYTRELIPEPSGIWFVRIKELPNCMSQGDTPEEALHMIEDAMRGWLEVELEDGEPIPEPREEEDYSGKFNLRVPKSLHRKLVEAAERDGVSLNHWINTALAEAIGGAVADRLYPVAPAQKATYALHEDAGKGEREKGKI